MRKSKYLLLPIILMLVFVLAQCSGLKLSPPTSTAVKRPSVDFRRAVKKLSTPWSIQRVSPVVSEDFIFQATEAGLISFNKNGKKLWDFSVKGGVPGSPLYYQKKVFFGAHDGYFYCLSTENGRLVWRQQVDHSVIAQPVIWKSFIYFITTGNELYALNVSTGKWLWHYKRGVPPHQVIIRGSAALALYDESFYAGFADGYVAHLNAATGSVLWTKKIGGGVRFTDIMSVPYVDKKQVLVLDFEGELHSLDKISGRVLWKSSLGGIRFFTVTDGLIYVTTANQEVAALKYDKGVVVWKQRIESGSLTAPVVLEGLLYVGTANGYLYILSSNNGHTVWRYREKYGFSASPTVFGKKVYVFSNSSRLIVFTNNS
ncbi:MAG TPA: PQQ-binding-like beta-propeller repeat protein [Bdellovibrionota bacterium]|nr:PQQ-binding-like beta-propeller repeat protein [Bdellovibrionota bacterium]